MLKKLLPLALIATASSAHAQSILNPANFNPVVGDAFSVVVCDTAGVTPGATGAGVTWNFTSLVVNHYDTGRAIVKTATAATGLYPLSNLAVRGPSFFSASTTYLIVGTDKISNEGYYASSDTNLILSDPVDQIVYPFTYASTFSDSYAGILKFGPITSHHFGTLNVDCDAWGTLNIPSGSHANALRVHSTQLFTDSANLFGTPIVKKYNIESYDWYKAGCHAPLMTIQTATEIGATTPTYKLVVYSGAQFNGVKGVDNNMTALTLAPNPATSDVTINFETATNYPVRISLLNATGREVAEIGQTEVKGKQTVHFDTKAYPRGLYFVHLQSANEQVVRQVILQ